MNLKTFTSPSVPEALALVRRELGPGAVILHTRSYKQGGIMGIGGRTVVEITAADSAELDGKRKSKSHRDSGASGASGGSGTSGALATRGRSSGKNETATKRPSPSLDGSTGDLIRRTYAVALAEMARKQSVTKEGQRSNPLSQTGGGARAGVRAVPTDGVSPTLSRTQPQEAPLGEGATLPITSNSLPSTQQLADEMRVVKQMVEQLMERQAAAAATVSISASSTLHKAADGIGGPRNDAIGGPHTNSSPPPPHDRTHLDFNSDRVKKATAVLSRPLIEEYTALLQQEVAKELAQEIVVQVRKTLAKPDWDDTDKVHQAVQDAIAHYVPVDPAAGKLEPSPDGRPRIIALVGPTGVGKTTTIAKLAANFKIRQKKQIALITLDTYRIAAVEQLRTYANIIGVPLSVAATPEEMATALSRYGAMQGILIDTAGRSQRDDPRLEQLAKLLAAAMPHEVHLVLASTCTQAVLLQTVERFSKVRADKIIFTKLDEATSYGVLLSVARKVNKQLSFLTTGQEVPHHIEPGQSKRLAQLVLGEKL